MLAPAMYYTLVDYETLVVQTFHMLDFQCIDFCRLALPCSVILTVGNFHMFNFWDPLYGIGQLGSNDCTHLRVNHMTWTDCIIVFRVWGRVQVQSWSCSVATTTYYPACKYRVSVIQVMWFASASQTSGGAVCTLVRLDILPDPVCVVQQVTINPVSATVTS